MMSNLPSLGNTRDFQYRLPYKDDNDDGPDTVNPEEEEKLEDEVDESEEQA